jgi:hypothetical protein
MTDAALIAFVKWARNNRDVDADAYLVRRVFNAFSALDDEVLDHLHQSEDD